MDGIEKLVAILKKMGGEAESIILKIEEKDPELAKILRDRMFLFEDIENLDKKAISLIIQKTDRKTLVLALKGTSESLRRKFYDAISQRVSETIVEDLEILGPVRKSDVEKAREKIITIVSELSDKGDITIGDSDYV